MRYKGMMQQSGLLSRLLLLVGFTFVFSLMATMIWVAVAGGNNTALWSLKVLQLLQSIGMFVLPPIVLAYLWSEKPIDCLKLNRALRLRDLVMVVLFMLAIIPFVNLLGYWNKQLVLPQAFAGIESWMKTSEAEATQFTTRILNVHSLSALGFNIFLVAFIPALGEEFFFRGALQQTIQKSSNAVTAIWIAAFVFSAIHLQFYGFVPRLLMGAFLGYLLLWSDSLWLPILAHFVNNLMAVIFYYLKNNGFQVMDIDSIGTGSTLWAGYVSGMVAIAGIVLLQKQIRTKTTL